MECTVTRDIDISLLRAFVAVVETGGMTSAGKYLNLTQAAVSQQIKRLEELFQAPVFDRSLRKLSLTPAGERLFARAQKMLAMNDEVWGAMTQPDFEGEVKLGVPHDVVGAFLPPILRSFTRAWPKIDVTLICNNSIPLKEDLRLGKLDLALTTEATTDKGGECLLDDKLVWAGAPDGDAHKRDPLPVTVGGPDCIFRPVAIKALTDVGRDWRFVCKWSDMSVMCATLIADVAVAPLMSQTVPDNLAILDDSAGLPPLEPFRINLYGGHAKAGPMAQALADHVRRSFAVRYAVAA
jgi:DNA-binding transcriptional LysR family regulator